MGYVYTLNGTDSKWHTTAVLYIYLHPHTHKHSHSLSLSLSMTALSYGLVWKSCESLQISLFCIQYTVWYFVSSHVPDSFLLKPSLSENGVLELGAQWVHGEVGNVVCSMAHKYGLLTASGTGILDTPFIDSTGKIVDQEVSEKMMEILSLIHKAGDTMLKEFKGSLGDYYTAV